MTLPDEFEGALVVGRKIARRQVSSVEVTQHILARIERLNRRLGAYVTVTADEALGMARRADAAVKRGARKSPLHGVPVAVKDLCDMAGQPTTAGVPAFGDTKKTKDSTVVARLKAAGAVILGKLVLTEGAMASHHPSVPDPINPWNKTFWSGVSSSGSGVAVAAGLCFGALGSDTAGSIRFPSQANHIVGLKPTWGRVSRAGVFALAETLDHVGPMARRVEDVAAMLGAIAGHDPSDPTSSSEPVENYLKAMRKGVKGLRLGIDPRYALVDVAPEIAKTVRQAMKLFQRAGAKAAAVRMPAVQDALGACIRIAASEAALAHSATYPARPDIYGPAFKRILDLGRQMSGMDYASAAQTRRALRAGMDDLFRDIDLMIMPVTPMLNPPVSDSISRSETPDPTNSTIRFTAPTDMTGYPTITLPAGFAGGGEPLAFQLVARPFEESILLRAGAIWERETRHTAHRPGNLR